MGTQTAVTPFLIRSPELGLRIGFYNKFLSDAAGVWNILCKIQIDVKKNGLFPTLIQVKAQICLVPSQREQKKKRIT